MKNVTDYYCYAEIILFTVIKFDVMKSLIILSITNLITDLSAVIVINNNNIALIMMHN